MSKNVPKCQIVSWGNFFEKFFLLSVPWSHRKFAKKSKKIQNCKKAQNRAQKFPNLLWTCFVDIFPKKKCHEKKMEGRAFGNFEIKSKKFQKSKSAQNRFQKCPNVFWLCFGVIFPIFFCPVLHAGLFTLSGFKNMGSVFRTLK